MTHKIVSIVVCLVLLLFAGAALAFAWSVAARAPETAGRPEAIPHPVDQTTAACARCHTVTPGTLPATHREFPTSSCGACHDTLSPTRVPHAVAGLEGTCVLCHGDPSLALGMPASHLGYRARRCDFCHAGDPRRNRQPAAAGVSAQEAPPIAHAVTGIFSDCGDCHRIDGRPSLPTNHRAFGEETCRFVCHLRDAEE